MLGSVFVPLRKLFEVVVGGLVTSQENTFTLKTSISSKRRREESHRRGLPFVLILSIVKHSECRRSTDQPTYQQCTMEIFLA